MCSSAVWISIIPFARFRHGSPLVLKTFASAPPPVSVGNELVAAALERGRREPDDRVGVLEAVALVRLADLGLERALGRARRERERVEHLLDEIGELARVVRARLRLELAPLGDDVARAAAADQADVRGRLLVDPAEPQVGDRARRGRDRGAPLLRDHPRVRRPAVEADEHRALVGRAHDHVADRRRLVVDEAELGLELREVEGAGADQADLLLRREEELDARVRPALLDDPARRLDHRHDRRLVVRAEDRPAGVPDDAVLADDGLERALRRHGVEVRAEEDRRPALDAARQAAEQVPDRRADRRAGVVLVDLEPERAQLARSTRSATARSSPGGLGIAASSRKRRQHVRDGDCGRKMYLLECGSRRAADSSNSARRGARQRSRGRLRRRRRPPSHRRQPVRVHAARLHARGAARAQRARAGARARRWTSSSSAP